MPSLSSNAAAQPCGDERREQKEEKPERKESPAKEIEVFENLVPGTMNCKTPERQLVADDQYLSTRKTSGMADSGAAVQCSSRTKTARKPARLTSQGVS